MARGCAAPHGDAWLAALTLVGGVVGPLALVLGLARLPATASSLLLNLEAVLTLAIAVLPGREHLGPRGLVSALLTIAGAVMLSQGSLSGAHGLGSALITLATLAWGIDNNLSQRLSLRDPIQIAIVKAAGASLLMLALALLLGQGFPPVPVTVALLGIGALGYGISIWLDLLALRDLGAAREAERHDARRQRALARVSGSSAREATRRNNSALPLSTAATFPIGAAR